MGDSMKDNLIITIGRQFGSAGREIGKLLAKELDIDFYDKDIIKKCAKESGIDEKVFENAEEIANNSLIYSLSMGLFSQYGAPISSASVSIGDSINKVQSEIIRQIAQKGSCIIIGRCADYVLKSYSHCIKVFIKADIEKRLDRVINVYGYPKDTGENFIRKIDRKRASYYSCYAEGSWGSKENYDLILDSGVVGIEGAVKTIKVFSESFNKKSKILKG